MQLTPEMAARAVIVLTVETAVYTVAARRELFRRLPIFTAYLLAVVMCDAFRFGVSFTLGRATLQYFVVYWGTQAILMGLRAAVVYELCRELLRPYPGVLKLCWLILLSAGLILVTFALIVNINHGPYVARIVLTIDRGIELGILGVLVLAMWFCRYYQIPTTRLIGMIGLGLSLYSALNIVSNTLADRWFQAFKPVWMEVRGDSFILAELIWLIAVWKPLPAPRPSPNLLDFQEYSVMTSSVNVRLRELNSWLEEVLR
jgi:hypothetical protein